MDSGDSSTPLVSVIVPVYNIASYVTRCVESIVCQTYENLEVILVDDGSTDSSGSICDEWEKHDGRIQVIHKENGGLSSARNAGIEKATGKYLLFVDGDDYVKPSTVEDMLLRARDTMSDIVISGFSWVREDGSVIKSESMNELTFDETSFWREVYPRRSRREGVGYSYFVVTWNKLYNKKLFQHIRFDEGKVHEDELILDKLLEQCETISTQEGSYYNYVQRPDSIMHSESAKSLGDAMEALLERSRYLAKNNLEREALSALSDGITILAKVMALRDREPLDDRLLRYEEEVKSLLCDRNLRVAPRKAFLKLTLFRISPQLVYCAFTLKGNGSYN